MSPKGRNRTVLYIAVMGGVKTEVSKVETSQIERKVMKDFLEKNWVLVAVAVAIVFVGYVAYSEFLKDSETVSSADELSELKAMVAELKAQQATVQQTREAAEEALKKARSNRVVEAVMVRKNQNSKAYKVPGQSAVTTRSDNDVVVTQVRGADHVPEYQWKDLGTGFLFPVIKGDLVMLGRNDQPPNIPIKEGYVWRCVRSPRDAGIFQRYAKTGKLYGLIPDPDLTKKESAGKG